MKQKTTIITALLCLAPCAWAQQIPGVDVSGVKTERNGRFLSVDMNLNLKELDVESNRAVLLTPWIVNGNDSTELKAVGIYGRRRYYYYVRNTGSLLTGKDEQSYRAKAAPDEVAYSALVPYKKWMDGARLKLRRTDYGCCNTIEGEYDNPIGSFHEDFFPQLVYITPKGETAKHRSLEGSAFIDFPVDKTVIYPEYRRNTAELGKIRATIDSVRSDKDISITQVWLKGYASPESPYSHNTMLAKGRTAALKTYIQNLYKFNNGVIKTDYEPEDWAGLRRYVEQSNLEHRSEILALIDSDREPDSKEWLIKSRYPQDYRFLLDNCYPALRHTDYRIAYDIRSYTDVEEIKRIMLTQPQKLSLNEFYLLSQQYEPGSDEFTEVFETAVRMYPDDEAANLNAANAAMRRDDLKTAKRYLAKAGSSSEAVYARAACAVRAEDYDTARIYLKKASDMGLKQATETLNQLSDY